MGDPSATPAPDDANLLRVSGSSNPGKLAGAIAHAIYDHQQVRLRAIGAAAVNQGVKAIGIAQGYAAHRGLVLSTRFGFENAQMPDGDVVSAIVMRVEAH